MKLEKLLNRILLTVGCTLHQNELPLKAVFKELDGGATGPRSFSGKIEQKKQREYLRTLASAIQRALSAPYKKTTIQAQH